MKIPENHPKLENSFWLVGWLSVAAPFSCEISRSSPRVCDLNIYLNTLALSPSMAFSLQRSVKKIPEFNVSLLEIANEITHDVLEDMKFVCDFPKGKLESINKPREFLGILQTSGKIAPGDVDYLVSLLEKVGSEALAKTVVEKLGTVRFLNNHTIECDHHVL